ncbi:hypothetical protein DSCA_64070 [Desulfosarcina alkanivorans]|jgi:hypothetical protein|uniref:Recombinase domain-containing protein n=1 Tax=Desulfosarcina alkanivorans TaxID=571177 RepID=A0A5K7Z7I9_9BACT|nr:hypothetical protein [Desulfosarcina alkanivorans]BBO72477.1 hypothetical protein DSCA_64070 [Desulfosarcina alkanivorans]
MDDFLHNLRSGKLKQPDRGRRDYSDYKGPQRRAGNERRKPDYYAKVTGENFALVKDSLDLLAENQKRIADALVAGEKTNTRIADALEAIADMMKANPGPAAVPPPPGRPTDRIAEMPPTDRIALDDNGKDRPQINAGNETPGDGTRPDILGIIASMREEGSSWEKIARHMDAQNIPTVSGKGKWRGQAIKKFWEANT